MSDREKVIVHLNDCMEASRRDNTWVFVRKDVVEDALSLLKEQEKLEERLQHAIEVGEEYKKECENIALLKEQEPKPVDLYGIDDLYGLVCVCPDCKAEWMSDKEDTHFCPKCGRAVKWE